MSTNPIDKNATPNPTGNLEELFRHHLGEEAAVPPRPLLWDQIDNSLLLRQNELYRRRLTATRWVAAASLLLATLAGTGWWARRDLVSDPRAVATGRPASTRPAIGANEVASASASRTAVAATTAAPAPIGPTAKPATAAGEAYSATAASAATAAVGRAATRTLPNQLMRRDNSALANSASGAVAVASGTRRPTSFDGTRPGTAGPTAAGASAVALTQSTVSADQAGRLSGAQSRPANELAVATTAGRVGDAGIATATASPAASATSEAIGATSGAAVSALAPDLAAQTAAGPAGQVGMLAANEASLSLTDPAALPTGLSTLPLPEVELAAANRWHYGASYTAGLFNPNTNFSRAGIAPEYDYSQEPAFGTNSASLTEVAAAQYRENLRPGLSQRVALLATRHLKGRWSLTTGVELGQASARSASSTAFVGEQLFDLGQQPDQQPLRTTSFRYRTAGIPVEMRYGNPVKRGWSLYGRLGGVVTALLGVRSEVAGAPEATRTYSITSAGTPYRRLLGSARGALGVQFRPASASWALTLAPTAEFSLMSLNAHSNQPFLHQSRAYGLGMEVGMEFGK